MQHYPAPDFMLRNESAIRLYEAFARDLPIVDYHCHLDPAAVAANAGFADVVDLWIAGDPYKWRAMRLNGVPERVITGDASAEERFAAWAATVPHLAGNPLFHWSAMEMDRYFGITETLCPANAKEIRDACNTKLRDEKFGARDLLDSCNVERFCTSDDWLDDLAPHMTTQKGSKGVIMLPSLRADKALEVDSPDYKAWLEEVSRASGVTIDDMDGLKEALCVLLDRFQMAGCRMADHGLDHTWFSAIPDIEGAELFLSVLEKEPLSDAEIHGLRSVLLAFLASEYARRGWIMQLHIGAERWTSSRLRRICGPAGGYACIGSSLDVTPLCWLLDYLDDVDALPRTILFPLNPSDYEMLASVTGSFSQDGVAGKVQLGPAWWYNDHFDGMRRQLKAAASYSLLGRFIGMTTDSRSFLSAVRHDYFRRLFCDLVGGWVTEGSLPDDDGLLGPLVTDVCYANAHRLLTA